MSRALTSANISYAQHSNPSPPHRPRSLSNPYFGMPPCPSAWRRTPAVSKIETFQMLQTLLAPGMDREVDNDFYSFFVHTGSTHTAFECDI